MPELAGTPSGEPRDDARDVDPNPSSPFQS